jgi:hypothetical protein
VNEDVFSATFLLDEAEALLAVEELYRTLAGPDDLCGHAAETAAAAAARATRAATAATRTTTAETVAAATAAEAITATAKPVAAAETIIAEVARGRETVIPATKRIETIFAETVALVAAAPASPIVTHISERTLPHCPPSDVPMAWTVSRTGHRRAELKNGAHFDTQHSAQRVPLRIILPERGAQPGVAAFCAFRQCLCLAPLLGKNRSAHALEGRIGLWALFAN